jgi:hypothetical protein
MSLTSVLLLTCLAAADAPLYEAELVFPGEDFHNHSSGIVETAEGDLIVCWFHGKGERSDDTLVISGARKNKGDTSWSAPFLMADNQNLPDQNCTLFIDPDGRLWLFWISSMDNLVRSYFLKYRYSTDYEGDGPPVWKWQDAVFCRPKDGETIFPELMERRIEQVKASTTLSEERKKEILSRIEERRQESSDKLFQRLGWMPRQPPIMLTDKRMDVDGRPDRHRQFRSERGGARTQERHLDPGGQRPAPRAPPAHAVPVGGRGEDLAREARPRRPGARDGHCLISHSDPDAGRQHSHHVHASGQEELSGRDHQARQVQRGLDPRRVRPRTAVRGLGLDKEVRHQLRSRGD